jgi:hypothetical protein
MKREWTKDKIELIKELNSFGLLRLSTQVETVWGYKVACLVCGAQGFSYKGPDGFQYQEAHHKDDCLADEIAHIHEIEKGE